MQEQHETKRWERDDDNYDTFENLFFILMSLFVNLFVCPNEFVLNCLFFFGLVLFH